MRWGDEEKKNGECRKVTMKYVTNVGKENKTGKALDMV